MKSYFAKYFPVEGEIKEGDIIKLENGGIYRAGKFGSDSGFTLIYNLDGSFYDVSDSFDKVKLFLCSRDIHFDDYKEEGKVHVYHDGSESPFKIVGEISPNAKWVKEGDEWDEDEIKEIVYKGLSMNDISIVSYQIKGPCGHFH